MGGTLYFTLREAQYFTAASPLLRMPHGGKLHKMLQISAQKM